MLIPSVECRAGAPSQLEVSSVQAVLSVPLTCKGRGAPLVHVLKLCAVRCAQPT